MAITLDLMKVISETASQSHAMNQLVGGRFSPGFAAEDSLLPYVTFWPVSATATRWTMDTNGPREEQVVRLQFDIYTDAQASPSPIQAFEVADALETMFDWMSTSGAGRFDNCTFRREQYRPVREDHLWRLTVDYLVLIWSRGSTS